MNHIRSTIFFSIAILFSSSMIVNADNLGVSTFKEYAGITSFLESQKKENPLAATLLTNTKLFSIDYSPSQYTRTRIQEPRYLNSLVKRGIEGYVVVEFDVNEDGSTSKHSILVSEPGNYFDAEALEASKHLRYSFDNVSQLGKHKHRFTFNLSESSRKIPSGYWRCYDDIRESRFNKAIECASNRGNFKNDVIGSAYDVLIAEANFYLGNTAISISSLKEIATNPEEESFYLRVLATTNLVRFLFAEERFSEILELEDLINRLRNVGYKEVLSSTYYYLGITKFYKQETVDALFYLKLSLQDTNCNQTFRTEKGESFIEWRTSSLYRFSSGRICYPGMYERTLKTIEAIDRSLS